MKSRQADQSVLFIRNMVSVTIPFSSGHSKKNLPLLLAASFFIGFIVTIAEPDVQVLADQVKGIEPEVSKWALIVSIAGGTGLFVMLGILRTILSVPLRWMLIVFYTILFSLAVFAPPLLQGVAFDSGGATPVQ